MCVTNYVLGIRITTRFGRIFQVMGGMKPITRIISNEVAGDTKGILGIQLDILRGGQEEGGLFV